MNKRQQQKHYKNKWRKLIALFFTKYYIPVKPSRIRMKTEMGKDYVKIVGYHKGVEMILNFCKKPEEKTNDEQTEV